MYTQRLFLILSLQLLCAEVSSQIFKQQFNYEPGTVTLKNGTVLFGEVANIKHGFRDHLLDHIRFKPSVGGGTKKYKPRKILAFSKGGRQFVSWRVQRNNSLFQEMYTIHTGDRYRFFELQKKGHVSIYLEYFLDDDLWIRSVPFFLKEGEQVMVRATQGMFGLKRNLLSKYFADCPDLIRLIEEKQITTPEEVALFYNRYKEEEFSSD